MQKLPKILGLTIVMYKIKEVIVGNYVPFTMLATKSTNNNAKTSFIFYNLTVKSIKASFYGNITSIKLKGKV